MQLEDEEDNQGCDLGMLALATPSNNVVHNSYIMYLFVQIQMHVLSIIDNPTSRVQREGAYDPKGS